jgi:hypothetical protein
LLELWTTGGKEKTNKFGAKEKKLEKRKHTELPLWG